MFKNTTTKIFLAFAAIILVQTLGLSYFYARVMLRESENFALENLSKRSEHKAIEIQNKLKQNYPIDHLRSEKYQLVKENGETLNLEANFSTFEMKSLLPSRGSLVSVCRTTRQEPYYCSLTVIDGANLWAIEIAPRMTLLAVLQSLAKDISTVLIAMLILAIGIAFLFSKLLLRPLSQFSKAARAVAQGEYENLNLPTQRRDEIGSLAQAFERMILDLKERERNITLSSMKLSHSSRLASIGQMGASIAHEVRNPLTSMIGYAKILKNKISEPQLQEAVEIIQTEAERCNQILQQMLRFARNDPEEKRAYSMKEVLQSCLLLLKSEAKSTQHEIQNKMVDDHILVGSPQQIQQVLINLLMNAMQASPKGTSISIKSKTEGTTLLLSIHDQGPGIPKNIQNRIFDPFFTTKKGSEGTGLGLSVAREIVQEQGGRLSFVSEEGRGTTFTIQLPLPHEEARASS